MNPAWPIENWPGDPVHEIQAEREDDVDGAEHEDAVDVGIEAPTPGPIQADHDRDPGQEAEDSPAGITPSP